MLFYADRISENIRKREPEGYLICVNVPIARSGTQQYLQDEVGQTGNDLVTVYRPEEEVFSKATIASFEGMPVTNDHPDNEEGVTADNVQFLGKGHCQNVRRGTGDERNMLIADLVITDPHTIQQVLDGKREISCGYNYDLCEEDGKLIQRRIRGNHIAIVDKGRAGHRVSIKDSAPKQERRKSKMAKTRIGILSKMLASFSRDAEPEEIEEAVNAIDEITTETPMPSEGGTNMPPVEEPAKDEGPDKLDTVIELLQQLLAQKGTDCSTKDEEEEVVDPLQKLEDDLDEIEKQTAGEGAPVEEEPTEEPTEDPMIPDEDPAEPESHFVDPDVINEQDTDETIEVEERESGTGLTADKRACDAARAALRAVKPVIAMLPPSQRKAASDAAVKQIRKLNGLSASPKKNSYLAIRNRKRAGDASSSADELGKRIMAARNVNYKK